jgi:hypothetical protein
VPQGILRAALYADYEAKRAALYADYEAKRAPLDADYEAAQAARRAAAPPVKMVKCSCGHTVPSGSVMSASMGSSCPDCYDRMSN